MPARTSRGRADAWFDGALDGLVAAFALWTVAYYGAMEARSSVWGLVAVWVPVAVLLVGAGAWTQARLVATPHGSSPVRPGRASSMSLRPAVLAAVVLLAALAALRDVVGILPAVVVALLVLGHGLVTTVGRSEPGAVSAEGRTWVAVAVGAGLAVLALLLRRTDADDVFYTNRAAWVAEHGVPAVRDTMFGPETYPSTYGDGLLFPSVEALFGALAHLAGVRAGTLIYLGAAPVLAFLVALATWRLVRAWAPRRVEATFLVAVLAMVAGGESILGAYSVGRIWQGKVIAFAILMPLVWVHLSAAASDDRRVVRRSSVMLLLSGVAFAGLTSGAPLLGPSVTAAGLLAAFVTRERAMALGALLFAVGPVVAGASVLVTGGGAGEGDSVPRSAGGTFDVLLGTNAVLVVVGVTALVLGVRALRPVGLVVASCAAIVSLAVLLPGVLQFADQLTGAGAIAWRLAVVVPLAVLIGALVALVVPDLGPTRSRLATGVAGAAVVAIAGTPLWADGGLASSPEWKVPPGSLDDVVRVLDLPAQPGSLLLPEDQSQALAVLTTERFATVPRAAYLASLDDTPERIAARYALFRWLEYGYPLNDAGLAERLDLLDVAVVCLAEDSPREKQLDHLAASVAVSPRQAGRLTCVARPGESWEA